MYAQAKTNGLPIAIVKMYLAITPVPSISTARLITDRRRVGLIPDRDHQQREFVPAIDTEKRFKAILSEPGYGARSQSQAFANQVDILCHETAVHA